MEILSFPIKIVTIHYFQRLWSMAKIVYEGGCGEIEVKKSRFIATVSPVHSEDEALDFIASLKKKYWNASHNCFAYVIGDRASLQRCSDDREPQGTAGRPMLDVLLGEQIVDAAVVVTRYFGGTLLGTGGLVRAYSQAVTRGLEECRILTKQNGILLTIRTDYTDLGKIQYLLGQRKISITDSSYEADVKLQAVVPLELAAQLQADLTEATGGRAAFPEKKEIVYGEGEDAPVFL